MKVYVIGAGPGDPKFRFSARWPAQGLPALRLNPLEIGVPRGTTGRKP